MSSGLPSATDEIVNSLEDYPDVTAWINGILSPISDAGLTELDQSITKLLGTLDIACEDTSAELERILDDVSRSVPRLTYDLHFMKDSALSLQSSVAEVHVKAKNAFQHSTSAALEKLRTLDTMKNNMEAAKEVLEEAQSWSSLEMDVTTLLNEQSYARAAERLSEANKSMAVFQNTPEFDPRRTLLVNLQNQLEASLSTALVSAINAHDLAACRSYYGIFSQIQRESEFRNYYNGSRRAILVSMWQEAKLSDCGEDTGGTTSFIEFLSQFYSKFLALLNDERVSIPAVFPDPAQSLSNLMTSVYHSLQPSFSQRLEGFVSHHGDGVLPMLIKLFKGTETFALNAHKAFEKIRYPVAPVDDTPPSPESVKLHRRRSSRMSVSWRGRSSLAVSSKLGSMDDLDWDQEVFSPFFQYQLDYGLYETRYLEMSLREIVTMDSTEQVMESDQARLMRERAVDIIAVAATALGRCSSFTYGFASTSLVKSLDSLFQSFIDMWTADVSLSTQNASTFPTSSDEELTELDYTAKDWANFQLFLHLLSSAHAVFERMLTFEIKLRQHLSQTCSKFRMAREDPENFPITPVRGETQLLEQSTLNSAELHELWDKIDPEAGPPKESLSVTSTAGLRHGLSAGSSSSGVSAPLLSAARASLSNFALTCQISLQSTILSPIRTHVLQYATASYWTISGDPKARTTLLGNDLQVPSFSLSPTEAMQRVGEGLINLPRLFETYADDDALSFSLNTLPHIDEQTLKSLTEQHPTSTPEMASSHHPPSHTRLRSITVAPKAPPAVTLDPEAISSVWLASLGHTFAVHLTHDILPKISKLTPAGAAQLGSDLDYLSKILSALNVASEELGKWAAFVDLDDADGKLKAQSGEESGEIWGQICRMRGWNIR